MSPSRSDALVSTQWLAEHLAAPDVRVVDASYTLDPTRDIAAEYRERHIPGAVFLDIDAVADTSVALPHTMPAAEVFASKVRALGLGDGTHVVVYDSNGGAMAACRAWWMFRVFGHRAVSVLDGGLPKWLREDRPVSDMPPIPGPRHFTARMDTTLLRTAAGVLAAVESNREQIVDARPAGRFAGRDPEPRPVPRRGRVPGSLNLPFADLFDAETQTLLPDGVLRDRFATAGVDLTKPLTATCGSGITACTIALAAHVLGKSDVAVYDGSWAEWSLDEGLPLETDLASA
jgi:thiosulfate/3-mercaptopyruvate sulfurtransferase